MMQVPADGLDPTCQECGEFTAPWLGDHLQHAHGLSVDQYLLKWPEAGTVSDQLMQMYDAHIGNVTRRPPQVDPLMIKFAGIEMPINVDVPPEACLSIPQGGYLTPTHGKLGEDIEDIAVYFAKGKCKPIWVWGPPGVGKDAVFHVISALTRRPAIALTIDPSTDIQSWRWTRSFDAEGTRWEEGVLLKALRDGYVTAEGKRVPYLIVLSDLDRASRQQMETLRQILDSIQGRVIGPTGEVYPVLPGTQIVATANSSGSGDATGRFTSNPIDAAILDRFSFKVLFHHMDPRDEESVLYAKYPLLADRFPKLIPSVMRSIKAVREAIEKEELFADFGHRTVCSWMDAVEAQAQAHPKAELEAVIRRGFKAILNGMPDPDAVESLKRLVDPFFKGGMVDTGTEGVTGPHISSSFLPGGPFTLKDLLENLDAKKNQSKTVAKTRAVPIVGFDPGYDVSK